MPVLLKLEFQIDKDLSSFFPCSNWSNCLFLWAVNGAARSQTWLRDFTFAFHFHALEKEMATHSSVLAWRIPGRGESGGLLSLGSHRVRHDWSDLAAAAAWKYTLCQHPFEQVTPHWSSQIFHIYFRINLFKFIKKEVYLEFLDTIWDNSLFYNMGPVAGHLVTQSWPTLWLARLLCP